MITERDLKTLTRAITVIEKHRTLLASTYSNNYIDTIIEGITNVSTGLEVVQTAVKIDRD